MGRANYSDWREPPRNAAARLCEFESVLLRIVQGTKDGPPHARRAIAKFILAISERGEEVSEELSKRVAGISIASADPRWQIAELEKITRELRRRQ